MKVTEIACLYFGCWNRAGHYLHVPGGGWANGRAAEYYGHGAIGLDGTLAPRRTKRSGQLVWQGQGETSAKRHSLHHESEEYPQGQFLLHHLDNGFTAIQWWDRNQGDERMACNSTILAPGKRTAAEMVAALHEHFPHVAENLAKAGIELVEIDPATGEPAAPAPPPSQGEEPRRGSGDSETGTPAVAVAPPLAGPDAPPPSFDPSNHLLFMYRHSGGENDYRIRTLCGINERAEATLTQAERDSPPFYDEHMPGASSRHRARACAACDTRAEASELARKEGLLIWLVDNGLTDPERRATEAELTKEQRRGFKVCIDKLLLHLLYSGWTETTPLMARFVFEKVDGKEKRSITVGIQPRPPTEG